MANLWLPPRHLEKELRKPITNPVLYRHIWNWNNNGSARNLGIINFAFDLIPELNREYGTPDWVRPTFSRVLKYAPGMSKLDRAWAICTSRDYAKTTYFGKILPLYLVLIGQYGIFSYGKHLLPEADYIRLRGKNQDESEMRLQNLTSLFSEDIILNLFGDLEPSFKEIRDPRLKLKNNAKLAILKNGYILQGQGLNRPARGANLRGRRPKADIADDVENKENTKTDTQRGYNRREILGEQFGGLDKDGLTVYIGNYVHQECLIKNLLKPESGWNRLFFTATYYKKDANGRRIEVSGWEKKYSLDYIRKLGEWYRGQGEYKIFMMEYYNKIISDKDYEPKTWEGQFIHKDGYNFVRVESINKITLDKPKLVRVHVVVSTDPAISQDKKSSDGIVAVTGFGEDHNEYSIDLSVGKFDIRDRYYVEEKRPAILAITPEDMENVKRVGMVEETVRKILQYRANGFVIENAGQQLAWYNDVKDLLDRLKVSIDGMPYHPKDEKVYKLETGLMNIVSAGRYYIKEDMPYASMETSQITSFPESNLDILDARFNARQMRKIPGQVDINTFGDIKPREDDSAIYNFDHEVGDDFEPYILF